MQCHKQNLNTNMNSMVIVQLNVWWYQTVVETIYSDIFDNDFEKMGKLFCTILICHYDSWNDFLVKKICVLQSCNWFVQSSWCNVNKISHEMSLVVTKSTHKNSQQLPDWFKQHTYTYTSPSCSLSLSFSHPHSFSFL